MAYTTFEKIREVWKFPMIFLNLYTKSPYNSGLTLFFQTDMIFFDQFKVPTIKCGKPFTEFMIPIALLKKFGS